MAVDSAAFARALNYANVEASRLDELEGIHRRRSDTQFLFHTREEDRTFKSDKSLVRNLVQL